MGHRAARRQNPAHAGVSQDGVRKGSGEVESRGEERNQVARARDGPPAEPAAGGRPRRIHRLLQGSAGRNEYQAGLGYFLLFPVEPYCYLAAKVLRIRLVGTDKGDYLGKLMDVRFFHLFF